MGRSIVNFETALTALKQGQRITQEGCSWFVFMQKKEDINGEFIFAMQSLPENVKAVFADRKERFNKDSVAYETHLAIVYDDNIIFSWQPTIKQLFEENWLILD